jgi:hypothetical protein
MPNPNQSRGCLFYGCITAAVLVIALLITGFFAYRFANRKLDEFVTDYTAAAPAALPKTQMAPEQLRALRDRVDQFTDALEQGREAQLILSAEEINALIENEPEFEHLRDKFYVFIEEDRIKSLVSYPLTELPLKRVSERYLNGTVTWNVALRNGVLTIRIEAVEVNEKPLPAEFMKLIQSENLAGEFVDDPESAKAIRKMDRIEVRDGKVFITSRAEQPDRPEPQE